MRKVLLALWLSACAACAWTAESERIMLVASYHAGFAWTDDQIVGLKSQLKLLESKVTLQVDYLDTKNVNPNAAYYQHMEAMLLTKYGKTPPRLLLAMDDDALDFALLLRKHHFPGVPVVFSGVARSRQVALDRESNLAGVFDDSDIPRNLSMMLQIRPNTRRVVVIHDQSRTSLAQLDTVRQVLATHSGLNVQYLTDLNIETMQARLSALQADDLVFQLAFNRDAQDRVLSHEEATDLWAAASNAPIVVTRDVSMRPGVLGGHLVTGRQQGEVLGKMALQALLARTAEGLGMHPATTVPTFDYTQLQRWEIRESSLPSGASVINRPPSTFEVLRTQLPWLLPLLGSMLVIIGLLMQGIRVRQRSERALRQSVQNYRELFASNTDAILVRDAADGTIVETNPRFHSMFGYDASETNALSLESLGENFPPYGKAETREWQGRIQPEGPQFFEWRARRKDGKLFWSEVSLSRYQSSAGQRIVATIRDISDRKLVEIQASEFSFHVNEIYQNLPVAVFAIDAQHKITFWNAQLTRITGTAACDVVGTTDTWRGLYPSQRPCLADVVVDGLNEDELQRLYAGKLQLSTLLTHAVEGEDYFPDVNQGVGMWLRFCAAPLRNAAGELVGAIETIFDVTALRQTQQTLQSLNVELEHRVTERTRALEVAMDELVQSKKMAALGSLVAGVAHELNTPLGNVVTASSSLSAQMQLFTQALLSGTARRSEVSAMAHGLCEGAQLIERNALRAGKLISDFKQVAIGRTTASATRFDLVALVNRTAYAMTDAFAAKQCQLSVAAMPPLWINGYPEIVERVLQQFLENALLHAFDGQAQGHVWVSLEDTAAAAGVSVVCKDDGCGVSEEHLKRLFEPFFTTKLGQGSSGLGLYTAYNLTTHLMGGEIQVTSSAGRGTCFVLHLPRIAPLLGAAESNAEH